MLLSPRTMSLLMLMPLLAGCAAQDPMGPTSFETTYEGPDYRQFSLTLGLPDTIADARGQPRLAYPLVIDGDADPVKTFYLDGDYNVVRIDEYCLDGADCRYHHIRYPSSLIPAPMAIGLGDKTNLTFTDTGIETIIQVTTVELEGQTASNIDYGYVRDPAWRGYGPRGTFVLDKTLAPTMMMAAWQYGAPDVLAKRTDYQPGPALPAIPAWPPRPTFALDPPGAEAYLDAEWRGEAWPMREPFDALLAASERARTMRAAGACIASVETTGSDGYEGTEAGLLPESFVDGVDFTLRLGDDDVQFNMRRNDTVVDDAALGPQWRLRYEGEVERPGTCQHAPRPNVDLTAWLDSQETLLGHAKAIPVVTLEGSYTRTSAEEIPHTWRNAVLTHTLQPEHIAIDQLNKSYIPYMTVLDGNVGQLLTVLLHPDDLDRLDNGAWAPVFEAL